MQIYVPMLYKFYKIQDWYMYKINVIVEKDY